MSKAIQKLRALTAKETTHEHRAAFVEQLAPDTNHRGACLILTANVETALTTAIERCLDLGPESKLMEGEDSYSAFAQKIELGFSLSIYGPATKSALTNMRHIRNAFAHAKIPLTFDTPEVKAVCELFNILWVLPPHVVRETPDKGELSPRTVFEEVANALSHNLIWWALEPIQEINVNAFKFDRDPMYPLYYRRKAPLP